MSFERPTITELRERTLADFVSKLELVGAVLRNAMVRVHAAVLAGAAHLLHGHIEFLAKQLFPDTSEDEFFLRQAAVYGFSQNAAGYATATATATGTNGTAIPAGTLLVIDGKEYEVDAEVTIASGTATMALTALEAGSDSTLSPSAVLTFESPISGVDSTATVIASTVDGSDEETIEELRTRFLEYLQTPTHGGSDNDFVNWSKEVSGVTRAWVYPLALGPGTVLVRFVRDNDVDIIPSSGEVTAVQTYIDTLKPAHATVTVAAPTEDTLSITISIEPDTTAMRAAVQASVDDFILRVATPRDSSDADSGKILLSQLRTAIGSTPDLEDYTMATPSADYTSAAGYLVTSADITWS